MDTGYKLHTAECACNYSAGFQSIIGNGTVEIVNDTDEKIRGLSSLMEHKELSENNLNIYTCLICPVCRYNTLKYVSIPAVSCGVVPNTEQIILRLNCSTYFPTVPNTGKRDWHFDERMTNAVTVFKLTVTELNCKEHL